MKNTCPSCGSPVSPDATVCPTCGENLEQGGLIEAISPSPSALPPPSAGGATGDRFCTECGAANPAGARFCSNCGRPLAGGGQPGSPHTTGSSVGTSASPTKLYLLAGAAVLAIAAIVYFASAPKEQMGPPENKSAASDDQQKGLPPGHPAMKDSAATAAQTRMIEELKGRLAANPSDTATELKLANLLYDAGRHAEAIPLYRGYLKANPGNHDVETDMAYSLYQTGDIDGSIVELKKVLAADSRHQNAGINLAMMYVEKLTRAIGEQRMAMDTTGGRRPQPPTPAKQLQDSLRMVGYKDSMFLWLNHVVAVDSTTPQGKRAAELIMALGQAHSPNELTSP